MSSCVFVPVVASEGRNTFREKREERPETGSDDRRTELLIQSQMKRPRSSRGDGGLHLHGSWVRSLGK